MSLLQRLKIETAKTHDRIEEAFDLEAVTRSIPAYRNLLGRLYGFHAVWEPLAEVALADPEFFRQRRKVALLETDLRDLGLGSDRIGRLPLCDPTVTMRTPAEAWGSMYVVEGATLGGMVIARYVERRLSLSRRNGCLYFRCYGAEVRPMWTSFGARLVATCGPADHDPVVAAARRTFEVLRLWVCDR
jgi:heme oxygenase (biliverdin-IX-beta and delta-forming)